MIRKSGHKASASFVMCHNGTIVPSVSLLPATIEASSDGLLVVDTNHRVTAYNRGFLEIWNIPKEVAEQGDAHSRDAMSAGGQLVIKMLSTVHGKLLRFENGKFFERYSLSKARKRAMYYIEIVLWIKTRFPCSVRDSQQSLNRK